MWNTLAGNLLAILLKGLENISPDLLQMIRDDILKWEEHAKITPGKIDDTAVKVLKVIFGLS